MNNKNLKQIFCKVLPLLNLIKLNQFSLYILLLKQYHVCLKTSLVINHFIYYGRQLLNFSRNLNFQWKCKHVRCNIEVQRICIFHSHCFYHTKKLILGCAIYKELLSKFIQNENLNLKNYEPFIPYFFYSTFFLMNQMIATNFFNSFNPYISIH